MEITEVRIKLMDDASERLQAFCSITFDDCFVIRDLKIIGGTNGPFVAMPSRKLTAHCPQCGCKNHLRAAYCNQCGVRLKEDRAGRDEDGRAKLYADIAHPINSSCREMIQHRVIEAFEQEIEASQKPGYVSKYDDFDQEEPAAGMTAPPAPAASQPEVPAATTPAATQQAVPRPHAPQGPHRTPARPGGGPASSHKPHGDFGAGIF